jgi:hypothetical protein
MMRGGTKRIVGLMLGGLAAVLTVGSLGVKAQERGEQETQVALPAEQVIASIQTAVAAKPGSVREVEAENEAGKTICEVSILAQDGKTYDVEVNAATNTVVGVEADDEDDGDEAEDDQG